MLEEVETGTIESMLDALPVDLTFMDAANKIRYFNSYRLFRRPPEIIGQDVHQCHQEASFPAIDRMIADFQSGASDSTEYIIEKRNGQKLRVRYIAVRSATKQYLGLVEMVEELGP